ncbi:MAG: hypothetical protein AAF226_00595 [Verrucomicrobiota bacterium]
MRPFSLSLILVAVACVMSSCKESKPIQSETFRLRYADSSVPPQYHRSYVLEIGNSEASLVFDSYGTQTAEASRKVASRDRDRLIELAGQLGAGGEYKAEPGATGMHSYALEITGSYSIRWDSLSADRVDESVWNVINEMKAFFPNFEALRELPLPEE